MFREQKSCLSLGKQNRESGNPIKRRKIFNFNNMELSGLKFGSIKELLSKDQMKLISGGSCTFFWDGSNPDCASGSSTVEGCQQGGDNNCDNNDCCNDVDCNC